MSEKRTYKSDVEVHEAIREIKLQNIPLPIDHRYAPDHAIFCSELLIAQTPREFMLLVTYRVGGSEYITIELFIQYEKLTWKKTLCEPSELNMYKAFKALTDRAEELLLPREYRK